LIAWVIASGVLGCLVGGYAARRIGSARVAMAALAGSGLICLIYPLVPPAEGEVRLVLLLLWGVLVVADSPQFSALVSQAAAPQQLGLALVTQNGIGFLISVVSIVLLSQLMSLWGERALWLLAPGPVLGLWAMRGLARNRISAQIHH
jgi:MFS family permease